MELTKQAIEQMLMTSDKAVARAILALNEHQTPLEQNAEATVVDNGVGFRGCDARIGTSMAKFAQRTGFLTAKQVAYWRKPQRNGKPRICVYAGQLLKIAQATAASKAAIAQAQIEV